MVVQVVVLPSVVLLVCVQCLAIGGIYLTNSCCSSNTVRP